MSSHTFTK